MLLSQSIQVHFICNSNFPEYPWKELSAYPYGYWRKPQNQRDCLDKIAKKLSITDLSQVHFPCEALNPKWYMVRKAEVIAMGGASLIAFYKNSLIRALRSIYPGSQTCKM